MTLSPKLKRLLSIAFFAAIVFFGAKVFSVETADCEIVFRLDGPPMPELEELTVRLYEEGETELVGEFRRYYKSGSVKPLGRWPLVISGGDYRAECELRSKSGTVALTLPVELEDSEAVSVYLKPPVSVSK